MIFRAHSNGMRVLRWAAELRAVCGSGRFDPLDRLGCGRVGEPRCGVCARSFTFRDEVTSPSGQDPNTSGAGGRQRSALWGHGTGPWNSLRAGSSRWRSQGRFGSSPRAARFGAGTGEGRRPEDFFPEELSRHRWAAPRSLLSRRRHSRSNRDVTPLAALLNACAEVLGPRPTVKGC